MVMVGDGDRKWLLWLPGTMEEDVVKRILGIGYSAGDFRMIYVMEKLASGRFSESVQMRGF